MHVLTHDSQELCGFTSKTEEGFEINMNVLGMT